MKAVKVVAANVGGAAAPAIRVRARHHGDRDDVRDAGRQLIRTGRMVVKNVAGFWIWLADQIVRDAYDRRGEFQCHHPRAGQFAAGRAATRACLPRATRFSRALQPWPSVFSKSLLELRSVDSGSRIPQCWKANRAISARFACWTSRKKRYGATFANSRRTICAIIRMLAQCCKSSCSLSMKGRCWKRYRPAILCANSGVYYGYYPGPRTCVADGHDGGGSSASASFPEAPGYGAEPGKATFAMMKNRGGRIRVR